MTYRLEISKAAQTGLRKIHPSDRQRVENALLLLTRNPNPPKAARVVGTQALRLRVGNYRIVYEVDSGKLTVYVVALSHRKKVYKEL